MLDAGDEAVLRHARADTAARAERDRSGALVGHVADRRIGRGTLRQIVDHPQHVQGGVVALSR